jgi:tripartite-type tricarboxylate transporter receptor subunit TctC
MKFPAASAKILALFLPLVLPVLAGAQAYPTRPIRLIVPTAAGNTTSNVARLIGQKLTESWGQQVIVDNRAGGNSVIGTEIAAKAIPDGYTLLMVTTTHVISASLLPNLPYDSIGDFAPVASVSVSEMILVIHPSVPAGNLQEFVALARAKPGQLNYATTGSGSVTHLAGELFSGVTGVKMQHIPYPGGARGMTDLIGGQVQLSFIVVFNTLPHIKAGRLRPIAITGKARMPALPQVPTFAEAGVPGIDINTWFGMTAPRATPRNVIGKLAAEITRIQAMPEVKERLGSQGLEVLIYGPEQFGAFMKSEMQKFSRIIKAADIKLE